jgi:pyruvate dehydrogenase E2 component (dihydrolipoamide acetyltransferase)
MTAGTLTKWRVEVGDRISQGDIIAEVETEKGIIEVEVFESGTVQKLLVSEGQKVPVGTVLAEIAEGADAGADADAETRARRAKPGANAPPSPKGAEGGLRVGAHGSDVTRPLDADVDADDGGRGEIMSAGSSDLRLDGPMASPAVRRRAHELDLSLEGVRGSGAHGRITLADVGGAERPAAVPGERARISPYARRIALERGIDLSAIRGTGLGGAIQASDVLTAKPGAGLTEASPAERMQRAIAAAMTRANDEIPHYYVEQSIDMEAALTWLGKANASLRVGERLVSGVLVLRAVARALRKHPQLNATWQAGEVVPSEHVHVGLAVSLRGGGLVAPALRNTDQGSLVELMARMTDLVARARGGALRSSEMTSATITLTSLGERGVESVTPIIFPPQVAIVGCGATAERPWVVGGRVVARPVMRVTLGGDHRVSNGHRGSRFLSTLDRLLQEPEKL